MWCGWLEEDGQSTETAVTVCEILFASTMWSAALARSCISRNSCRANMDLTWVGSCAKKKARRSVSASLLWDSSFRRSAEGDLSPKPEILRSSASFRSWLLPKAPSNAVLKVSYFF